MISHSLFQRILNEPHLLPSIAPLFQKLWALLQHSHLSFNFLHSHYNTCKLSTLEPSQEFLWSSVLFTSVVALEDINGDYSRTLPLIVLLQLAEKQIQIFYSTNMPNLFHGLYIHPLWPFTYTLYITLYHRIINHAPYLTPHLARHHTQKYRLSSTLNTTT